MVIYKCDKCGREVYRPTMTRLTIEFHEYGDTIVEEYQFCDKCTKKFFEWTEETDHVSVR